MYVYILKINMADYIDKFLLIEWDLHDASNTHHGWDNQFVQENMGTSNYMCHQVRKAFNKMLNNNNLMRYIKNLLYVDKVDMLNKKDMKHRINKYQKSYTTHPSTPWIYMDINYLFQAIYNGYKNKLNNDEFNLLYLAAEECGYYEIFDGDDRIKLDDNDNYYLEWSDEKIQKIC